MSSYTRLDQILRQKPKRNRDDLKKHDSEIDQGKTPEKISPIAKKMASGGNSGGSGGGASAQPQNDDEKIRRTEQVHQ